MYPLSYKIKQVGKWSRWRGKEEEGKDWQLGEKGKEGRIY